MYRRILLASDGSIDAGGALEPAIALTRCFDAQLKMLIVTRRPHLPILMAEVNEAVSTSRDRASYAISIAERRATSAGIEFQASTLIGPFVQRILEYIDNNPADLLVIGKPSQLGILAWIFPTASERLIRKLRCSVHFVNA